MKNSALKEDDAAYVESFADSLRSEKSGEQSDMIMGQMLTSVRPLLTTFEHNQKICRIFLIVVILCVFLLFKKIFATLA